MTVMPKEVQKYGHPSNFPPPHFSFQVYLNVDTMYPPGYLAGRCSPTVYIGWIFTNP